MRLFVLKSSAHLLAHLMSSLRCRKSGPVLPLSWTCEANKRLEDAKKREDDAKKRAEDAKKLADDANKRADDAIKQAS